MRTSVAAAGSSAQSRRRCGSGKPSLGADVVRGEPQSQVQIGSSRWYKNACVCECVSERERERVCVCVRGSGACVRKRACQHMRACVSFLSLRACAASRRNCSADRKCGVPAYARRALHASAPSSCNKRGQRCPLCPSASTHVLCSHVIYAPCTWLGRAGHPRAFYISTSARSCTSSATTGAWPPCGTATMRVPRVHVTGNGAGPWPPSAPRGQPAGIRSLPQP
jgi:hypothetical protein